MAAPGSSTTTIATRPRHGHDLQLRGLTVAQVVHDYGDVCQAITELAMVTNAPISTEDFRTLNRCLDDAIAGAIPDYAQREIVQSNSPIPRPIAAWIRRHRRA